jgi:hypothetical protein
MDASKQNGRWEYSDGTAVPASLGTLPGLRQTPFQLAVLAYVPSGTLGITKVAPSNKYGFICEMV